MSDIFDFGWGEPFCVREALKRYLKSKAFKPVNIDNMGYTPDDGDPELIKLTKLFLKETIGKEYKHVIITNGTTGALNVVLRCLHRKEDKKLCITHKYHFPYYPEIIKKNGYSHTIGLYQNHEKDLALKDSVGIVDSPSNPTGDLLLYSDHENNVIWDSVYHNPVYINTIPVKPDHRVNCGSYSKVFGLTGLRIGWIATNSDEDYQMFMEENLYENCTLPFQTQDFMKDILNNTDLYNFMRSAKYRINNNREMFDKISNLFNKQPVPENGMFYTAWTDPYVCKLLDRLDIKCVELDEDGDSKFLRFNLAQTNDVTNRAIRRILKEDKR
jgi:aspartate/methionine/tyrosine aminotransferase